MTLPYERTNAVNYTREFLYDLLNPKKTPRIPKEIRQRARALLKHYPTEYDMDRASGALIPTEPVFGKDTLRQILKERLSPGCSVCGLGANGQVTGYVCNHPNCPTRISS